MKIRIILAVAVEGGRPPRVCAFFQDGHRPPGFVSCSSRMPAEARRLPFAKSAPEDEAGDGLWNAYLDAVEDEDKASVESWNGSTTGILVFVRLPMPIA